MRTTDVQPTPSLECTTLPDAQRIAHDPDIARSAENGDGDAIAILGIAWLRLGDWDGARERFESCTQLRHPTGLHGLAALAEERDPDGSWSLMAEGLALGAIPALTRIARILLLRDIPLCGQDLLYRAAKLGDADAMYDLAHLATDEGDDPASRRWYSLAVEREAGLEWPIERGVGYFLL